MTTLKNRYLSEEKHRQLSEELMRLKTVERKKNAENLEYAKSLGDLSENAEYHEARDKQADVEDRIRHLEQVLKESEIIGRHENSEVAVGAIVTVKRDGGQAEDFQIVGAEESNMLSGKISYESPIGSALLGHQKGDKVTVTTPKGDVSYQIIEIK